MKEKLFQIFFCLYIFWDVCLSTFLGIRGLELDGTIMRIVLVGIAIASWLFYFSYSPKYRSETKMVVLLVLFGFLFYSTQYIHDYCINHKGYIGQLLRWGADCVSGCLIGMMLTKTKNYSIIHKILPLECLALTPFMAVATVTLGATQGQMKLDGGMNYQTVAYSMAVLFCFSLFYTFIYNSPNQGRLRKNIMMIAMLIQAACCAMSGGRGGLVLLVFYVCYMSFYMVKNRIISKKKFVVAGFASVIAFLLVANYLGVFQSSGFERSSNSINDVDRFEIWKEYLKYVEYNPIFGYGLGGDYFTVGFYSHNMMVDFLLELGIFGSIVMIYAFYKTYQKIYRFTMQDPIFIVVMILFVYGMVMNMFSGYWISMNTNWLCFGVAMTASNYYKSHVMVDLIENKSQF